jgi:hypothetical protein
MGLVGTLAAGSSSPAQPEPFALAGEQTGPIKIFDSFGAGDAAWPTRFCFRRIEPPPPRARTAHRGGGSGIFTGGDTRYVRGPDGIIIGLVEKLR